MKPTPLHRRHLPWAIALVLVWQLFAGWGQVHRVLHLGLPVLSSASAPSDAPALGDEDGSGLCQLLDQLSLGSGLATAPLPTGAHALPLPPMYTQGTAVVLAHARLLEARGPPRL